MEAKIISQAEQLEAIRRHLVSLRIRRKRERHTNPNSKRAVMGSLRNFYCKDCHIVVCTNRREPIVCDCKRRMEPIIVPTFWRYG
jgi:hypothetical protein